ncbi:CRISPR-associated endonuclease Cas2 [Laribacter hongkongensis]|uniref:CRISPR-associated endoribonuclease Cas2 n=2 Tax=Laribacter hongkongensis TaxID=168471 RepID=A0ABD4SRE5_9NEIS|nr:CRISPR-associated endonuclease Cas2 [Laribacter hongkongensis]MCG9026079.1 CRISPR-associated endonuclease Cas2 [Laribacter hongkongensis]
MWVIAVYDCPMTTPEARHDYAVFHRRLLQENFTQLQNSLYVRHFPSMAAAEALIARLKFAIPNNAQLAFFLVTDKQYGMTREFFGQKPTRKKPDAPEQIELF